MWRIAVAMALMFGAVGWSAIAMILIFLIVPNLWESLFGPAGAPFAAVAAFGLMIWSSAKLMRLADRLLGEPEHRPGARPAAVPVEADVPADWHDYTAEIVRSKRWAFYRRTRQFDRLVALEEQDRAAAPPAAPVGDRQPSHSAE